MKVRKEQRQAQPATPAAIPANEGVDGSAHQGDPISRFAAKIRRLPNEVERRGIAMAKKRTKARTPRIAVLLRRGPDGRVMGLSEHSDAEGHAYHIVDTFGTRSLEFVSMMMSSLSRATEDHSEMQDFGPGSMDQTAVNAALAIIAGVRPTDEIEAMLAAHMAVTSIALLELVARTRGAIAGHLYQGSGIKRLDVLGNLTTKFMRTYTMQVEALARKRRKGEQHVTVKHVHVHAGGQAVVGNVTHRGGRGIPKNEQRACQNGSEDRTTVQAISESPFVRCTNQEREVVPVASDGERPLPIARRRTR